VKGHDANESIVKNQHGANLFYIFIKNYSQFTEIRLFLDNKSKKKQKIATQTQINGRKSGRITRQQRKGKTIHLISQILFMVQLIVKF
jgi:hypothetical protein